jgi:hypothetical protein
MEREVARNEHRKNGIHDAPIDKKPKEYQNRVRYGILAPLGDFYVQFPPNPFPPFPAPVFVG